MKLKQLINNLSEQFIICLKRFPSTIVLLIAFAITSDVCQYSASDTLSSFKLSLLYSSIATLFISLLIENNPLKKAKPILSKVVSPLIGLSTILVVWPLMHSGLYYYIRFIYVFYGATLAILFLFCLFLLSKKKNANTIYFELFVAFLFAFFSVFVLILGLLICLFAVRTLFSVSCYDLEDTILRYLWFVIAPIIFLMRIPREDKEIVRSKFCVSFSIFIVIPCLILLAILLVYVLKILLTCDFPSGKLNGFASLCVLIYLFIYATLRGIENKFLAFVIRWCWIPIIPIIITQIVGIVVRYNAYGLTTIRMTGMVLLVLGVYGLYLVARNKSIKSMFPFGSVLIFIFLLTPINVFDFPNFDQNKRLIRVLEKNSLLVDGKLSLPEELQISEKDKKTISSCLDYLNRTKSDYILVNYFDAEPIIDEIVAKKKDFLIQTGIDTQRCIGTQRGIDNHRQYIQIFSNFTNPFSIIPTFGYDYTCGVSYDEIIIKHNGDKWQIDLNDVKELFAAKSVNTNNVAIPNGTIDVTDYVEKIFRKNSEKINLELLNTSSITIVIDEEEAIWLVSDDVAFIVSSLYNPKVSRIKEDDSSISLDELEFQGYLLFRRSREAKNNE